MDLNAPADAPAEPTPTPAWPTVDDIPPTTAVYLSAPADWYASLKPTFDTIVAAVGVVLLFPFIVIAWAAIKISSPGPGLYVQTRAGRGNRPFSIYKIRSMKHDLATAKNLNWATQGDSRITWVGQLLRKLHLDELPQLFNVLRGEMSLVGPRPERPGVTGLAQIQLPADTDITSVRHKVYYDLYYLAHQSVWLDARICVGTVLKCFLRAETLRKILFLPTRERVCEHFLSLLAAPDADAEAVPVPVV